MPVYFVYLPHLHILNQVPSLDMYLVAAAKWVVSATVTHLPDDLFVKMVFIPPVIVLPML